LAHDRVEFVESAVFYKRSSYSLNYERPGRFFRARVRKPNTRPAWFIVQCEVL